MRGADTPRWQHGLYGGIDLRLCAAQEQVCEGGSAACAGQVEPDDGGCFPVGLETAGHLLHKTLGQRAEYLWAIALLASGQSSTITGTYAGQFVMQGFVQMALPRWARNLLSRLMAIVPSLVVALVAGAKGANDLVRSPLPAPRSALPAPLSFAAHVCAPVFCWRVPASPPVQERDGGCMFERQRRRVHV